MDKIKVSSLEFYAYHGVLESEKEEGQMFSIDCEFSLDTSLCGDDLSKTVHYGELSCEIVRFCQKNRFDLLENLINSLAKHLLKKYNKIKEITLTIHKPNAPIPTKFSDVTVTITRGWKTCYLAIGSNLGNKKANLDMVSTFISEDENILEISKSSYMQTAPYGVIDQPNFLNGVIKIKTIYTPYELLAFCKHSESAAGRAETRRWGERTLDIDILMYGDEIIFTDSLIIPHPEMHIRDFVLNPLCEIEPYLVHPIYKANIKELLQRINN